MHTSYYGIHPSSLYGRPIPRLSLVGSTLRCGSVALTAMAHTSDSDAFTLVHTTPAGSDVASAAVTAEKSNFGQDEN
jgi:hypothetical protein